MHILQIDMLIKSFLVSVYNVIERLYEKFRYLVLGFLKCQCMLIC